MKLKKPIDLGARTAWNMKLSAAHRGPRPGKTTVQKAPKNPNWKVRF